MDLAWRIAERLGKIEGVVAVVLGGSRARGAAHRGSDLDLGIYYREEHKPSLEDLHQLAQELGYRRVTDRVTDYGEWGPWINGGAWLTVEGQPVDWLYRELGHITQIIEDCRAGRTAVHYQPGHPHGFHEHFYVGEVHYCLPLYDPEGTISHLKRLTTPYPPQLKQTLIRDQLWEARFALDTCRKAAIRGDAYYVAGCLPVRILHDPGPLCAERAVRNQRERLHRGRRLSTLRSGKFRSHRAVHAGVFRQESGAVGE